MNQSMKNKNRLVIFVILAMGFLGYLVANSTLLKSQSEGRIGKVARETLIQRVTIAGTVEPTRSTVVTAPYDGYVKRLFVKLGQKVQSGEPMVSIAQSLQASENVFPIRAPFTGTVTQLLKSEGQFSKQSDPKDSILRIDDLSKLFINANSPEIDVVKIQSGMEVEIKVSAVLSKNYKGIVREISQAATLKEQWGEKSQVDYLIKLEILDADTQLKPGMTAIVDIIANKKEGTLTLEHDFIQKENENYFVILKNGNRQDIKVGLQNESVFEIAEGLKEGQEVRQVDFLKLIEKK